jgi:uncharacterized membrane protein YkvA (DUF1232 family)
VIEPYGGGGGGNGDDAQTQLKEYALFVPRFAKLLGRLMRDPRVPARSKAVLVAAAGYIVSPIDIVPDRFAKVGRLDDIVIAAFALDHILKQVPDHVLREHWEGDEDVLDVVRNVIEIGAGLVPSWLRRVLPT